MEKEETLPVWHQTIDFDALMREARKHITALSGKLWTDHNSSDPGITQLEVLAFCIADLSYRTSFGVDDIIAGYKGEKSLDIDLPLANSALPNAPVTIKDLRKILLDMPHPSDSEKLLIRNAFPAIAEGTEIPFYAVSHKNQETHLSFTNEYLSQNPDSTIADVVSLIKYENQDKIDPNGLYNIQLEFEEEENETEIFLKDLNQNYFEQPVIVGNNSYRISVLFPYWDDINWNLRNAGLTPGSLVYRKRDDNQEDYFFAVDKLNYDDYFYDYYAELELEGHLLKTNIKLKPETPIRASITIGGQSYGFKVNFLDWNELSNGVKRIYAAPNLLSGPSNISVSNVSIEGTDQIYDIKSTFEIDKNGSPKEITLLTRITFPVNMILPNENDVKAALTNVFQDIYLEKIALETAIYTAMKDVSAQMYTNYLAKLNRVFSYLYNQDGVWSYIGKYRNLCEDYSKFAASRIQEIALFGKLIVAPHHNVNELLAEAYFRIDQFLHPLIKFNTLDEITDKGYRFEDIFNGPLLKHGFIEDKDLENLKRRSVIYTSDLIRILMDIPGVEAVEGFNISSYIDNRLMGRNVVNCLNLTTPEVYKPRLSIEKSALSVSVNGASEPTDFNTIETWYLLKLKEIKDHQKINGFPFHLELPLGVDMEIENYKSIQNDYPEIYGIGDYGLPLDATEQRQAEARQLKAYLLFFEQLLANYLQQVSHLPELFSYNRSIDHTYAIQPLYNVPDVAPLFQGFVQNNSSWEAFKQDLNNSYQTALREGESTEEWRSRRNRFLSQMIGRFGESFEAYAIQLFDQHKHILNDPSQIALYQQKRGEVLDRLIDDKISFGEDLEKVTGGRYQSFDTTRLPMASPTGSWNNDNIGSYKLRLCRLLGIKTVNNQFLFGTGTNGEDLEGLHIVEHILLRPRTSSSTFLGIENRLNEDGSFVYDSDKDPYSFRITIVLPVNAGRFTDASFRIFAERLIRMETPAHVLIDFRWMNTGCGKNFELHYSRWKDGLFLLQPHLFQHINQPVKPQKTRSATDAIEPIKLVAETSTSNLALKGTDITEIPLGKDVTTTITNLQNSLIRALNTPCKLDLKLYDQAGIPFSEIDGKITFEDGARDIFNLRFSDVPGELTLFKWNESLQKWVEKNVFKNIAKPYQSTTSLLGKEIGLTTNYGGEGNYLLSYQIEDRIIQKIVNVTKKIIPAKIYIGNAVEMSNFNTETDGIFEISRTLIPGYFLQMTPKGDGKTMISSANGLAPTPLALTKTENKIQFSSIYKLYGAGTFKITYELDGQSTFALIRIVEQVAISAWNGTSQLTPGEDGIIRISGDTRIVKLAFDPAGGNLNVYDPQVSLSEPQPFDPNALPIGTIVSENQIGSYVIDRDKQQLWQDGNLYNFSYEFNRTQANIQLLFEAKATKVEAPQIEFLMNDIVQDFATIILPSEDICSINCSPEGGIRSLYKDEETGMRLIQQIEINAKNATEPFFPNDLEEMEGTGVYMFEYKSASGIASVQFSLVRRFDPVIETASIRIFNSVTESIIEPIDTIYTLVFNYLNKDQFFDIQFSSQGMLSLMANETPFLQEEVESVRRFMSQELPSNDYLGTYSGESVELSFGLNVINLNPTFVLKSVSIVDAKIYSAIGFSADSGARSYSWRINGAFVSRAKEPKFLLDFTQNEVLEIQLTLFLDNYSASYAIKVSPDLLNELMNA